MSRNNGAWQVFISLEVFNEADLYKLFVYIDCEQQIANNRLTYIGIFYTK